jgi:predicted Zn-dependent protease
LEHARRFAIAYARGGRRYPWLRKGISIRRFDDFWTARAEPGKFGRPVAASDLLFAPEAQYLLENDLARAEERARRLMKTRPLDPQARYLLGAVLRRQERNAEAREVLTDLVASFPQLGFAWRDLGIALQQLGDRADAINALLNAIDAEPVDREAWRHLGAVLFAESDGDAPNDDRRMVEARKAYREDRYREAESILRPLIDANPENVRALKLFADITIADRRWSEAKPVLERCVSLAPDFVSARFRLASMLLAYNDYGHAFRQIGKLLELEPGRPLYRHMLAIVLGGAQQFEEAIAIYEQLLAEFPDRCGLWGQYAYMVKSVRPDQSVALYQEMLRRFPYCLDYYYYIAIIKTFRLDGTWCDRVLAELTRPDLTAEWRIQLHFVLGKAYEDQKQYAKSFEHYKASNDLLFDNLRPNSEERTNFKLRSKSVYSRAFFGERVGTGCQESGPIFIVGMPRSGSTLVDQILASHSMIEGIEELDDLFAMVESELNRDERGRRGGYPQNVPTVDAERLRSLGEQYMVRTRRLRSTSRPFFTDKAPINFEHVGLVHLILPNARIIDARRHPMDCCFSCYKQYFPAGQRLTTNLRTVGRSYVDYVELMAHWDHVLPGRVHRVIYENMVANPEDEIRRLLAYIGVPFEERCLRFHETERFVRTSSAEQVRTPLYKSGVAHWKHYEQWLDPLKEALGGVVEYYPDVPEFFPRVRAQSRPWELGTINEFDLVKGLRQPPFEGLAPDQSDTLAQLSLRLYL